MRWLAFLLVLLNVGFFGWHYWLPGPLRDQPRPLSFEAAPSLDRLGEVDLDDFVKRVPLPLRTSGPGPVKRPASRSDLSPETIPRVRSWGEYGSG